ncbi:hypothetical protein GCM10010198_24310 [Nocardia seriolae]|nr:hypothetical protein NSERKGN1266_01920 [Nocardia seriolae]BEK92279.1 hypothetical protein NSER024013_01850 [Nocardia seriolae]GEM24444.1 hypothetical protein NS2_26830 [Nocardia seriolae NBRC 15557]
MHTRTVGHGLMDEVRADESGAAGYEQSHTETLRRAGGAARMGPEVAVFTPAGDPACAESVIPLKHMYLIEELPLG